MNDLPAAARILAALADALDTAPNYAPASRHTSVEGLRAMLVECVADDDDRAVAAALLDAARAELAVPEITCPSCSTTIRARLMDQPGALAAAEPPVAAARTLTEAELPRIYELCAQVCGADTATVAGHFLGQLRDLLGQPRPRVWLPGDTVPAGVRTVDTIGRVFAPIDQTRPCRDVLIEIPARDALVAAEKARRETKETP